MRNFRPQIQPYSSVKETLLSVCFPSTHSFIIVNSLLSLSFVMGSTSTFPTIKEVRTFLIDGVGSGGDYHNVSPTTTE